MSIRSRIDPVSAVAILLLVALFAGYVLYQARALIRGPVLAVQTPAYGEVVTDRMVRITGEAANISYLSLNDRQIFVNEHGAFSETLVPPPGYTILTVEAEDRFGRVVSREIEFIYKPQRLVRTQTP